MTRYILERILAAIPTLLIVTVFVFLLQKLLPGDPILAMAGEERDPVVIDALREKYGFNLRGSVRHRTSFLGELTGFGGARQLRLAQGETIVDAQIGYDFQDGSALEGLSLYLQGQNLTDEPFRTQIPGEPLQIIDNQQFGRRYLAGASFKF